MSNGTVYKLFDGSRTDVSTLICVALAAYEVMDKEEFEKMWMGYFYSCLPKEKRRSE